jgi:hypothetical protein
VPKVKFIGAGKSDGFGGAGCLGGGRTAGGRGGSLTAGGGGGTGACSAGGAGGGGRTSACGAAGAGSGGGGGSAGAGSGGVGTARGGGAGDSAGGGKGGVGSGIFSTGGEGGTGGVEGVAWRSGFGSVGPFFRPLSNSMVTAEGGGSNSGFPSCRIVTSNRTPIATWISREIRTARRIRLDWRRDRRTEIAPMRRDPVSGMPKILSVPQQEQPLLPE